MFATIQAAAVAVHVFLAPSLDGADTPAPAQPAASSSDDPEARPDAAGTPTPPTRREARRLRREERNQRIEALIEREERSFRGVMRHARRARCATAVCWGPSDMWALEPLVELPLGKSFSLPGSSLAQYMNSNELQVSFNAGLRLWMLWDWVSVSVYMSKVFVTGNDTLQTSTSSFPLPVSQIRRPFPGLGVGLFGDILWLSVDYDQLRNGSASTTKSPDFPANAIVSHAFTFTVAIAPIAGLRNGIGTAVEQRRKKEQAAREAAAAESRRATSTAAEGDGEPEQTAATPPDPGPPPAGMTAPPGADPAAPGRLSLHPRRASSRI